MQQTKLQVVRLTDEDRQFILKCVKEGVTTSAIARVLKRSPQSIGKEIRNGGGRTAYDPEKTKYRSENNGWMNPFTLQERFIIEEELKTGKSIYKLSTKLGRSGSGLYHEIQRGGGRDKYTALQANEKAIQALNDNSNITTLKRKITPEIRLKIRDFLDSGYSCSWISREIGVSLNTIMNEIYLGGGKKNYDPAVAEKNLPVNLEKFKTNLSLEERKQIEEFFKQDLSIAEISRRIRRSKNIVSREMKRAGGRDNYSAEQAHLDAFTRKGNIFEKLNTIKQTLETNENHNQNFIDRIENLEMQIDIILETLREIKNVKKH